MASRASGASELTGLLASLPITEWGVADIRGLHSLAEFFPRAISLAAEYRLPADDSGAQLTDAAYHEIQLVARRALEGVLVAISSHLLERHLPHLLSRLRPGGRGGYACVWYSTVRARIARAT